MKRTLFLFGLIGLLQACGDGWDASSVEGKLCREWKPEKLVESDGKETPASGKDANPMVFHANHTATSQGEPDTAHWAYDEKGRTLRLYFKEAMMDTTRLKIVELTNEKLILTPEDTTNKAQFHFKATSK